ncbi:MAG: hypothetical protein BWZ04_01159 [Firmicutes bacterium ADurb.BinA205]|nr:MAG: hypothetical protein BWZ04_01159 [Firmicutes bacterium ADurb.BinA205]
MTFEERFQDYLQRLKKLKPHLPDLAEESTKTSLVMPFFAMLGYDVFNASEFAPEYTCDVATKKGEKIDYAVIKDGEPIMLIEAKRAGMKLQKQQQGQLFRYFSTNRCRIAILTNGISYQFFSDLNSPNVMDDEPFLSFNLLDDDPNIYLSSVRQFSKEKFNVKNVISKAVYQKYSKVVQKTLKEDLISPSDELVKYFLSRPEIKTGNRITAQMIEKYREATQKAMQKVFGAVIQDFSHVHDEDPVSPDNDNTETEAPPTMESISDTITKAAEAVPDVRIQNEEHPEFIRLHIYTTNNTKFGVVKIMKSNLSIQLRKIVDNQTNIYDLKSAEEFINYI